MIWQASAFERRQIGEHVMTTAHLRPRPPLPYQAKFGELSDLSQQEIASVEFDIRTHRREVLRIDR
jgi:hypothetical protein